MQVTETLNEGLKRAYSIKLTAKELDTKVNEKLHQAQPDFEMKGFRKGKVPIALLKRQWHFTFAETFHLNIRLCFLQLLINLFI